MRRCASIGPTASPMWCASNSILQVHRTRDCVPSATPTARRPTLNGPLARAPDSGGLEVKVFHHRAWRERRLGAREPSFRSLPVGEAPLRLAELLEISGPVRFEYSGVSYRLPLETQGLKQ